jgi:alginate O-acetyltransferase complex protein AlgI
LLFNSIHFLIFFPLVTAGYFLLPHRIRWIWLLVASCYFYMVFRPIYILILAFTILVDYMAGLWIARSTGPRRKYALVLSIAANVGVLAFFKYFNFLNFNLDAILAHIGRPDPIPFLNILLPIGLSFHTFQSLSYTIEVYRGRQDPERHLGVFALYVMYYPQLVAGPIERPQQMLPQLKAHHRFDYARVTAGLKLMLWGMLKKVVIADRLASFVSPVYDNPASYPGISICIATLFFAFQIYCDFSGYTDIALGSSQVMGITLMRNFNRPYFSNSISDFWRRWHISLSSWFRDYVYFSMGGNRTGPIRHFRNLMATFLLSGLWHGANWTYVAWGGLNGLYLTFESLARTAREWIFGEAQRPTSRAYLILRWAITFGATCLAWILFRAKTMTDAWYMISHLTAGFADLPSHLKEKTFQRTYILLLQDKDDFLIGLAAIAGLVLIEWMQRRGSMRERLAALPTWGRWSVYYGAVGAVLFLGAFNRAQEFIYFQF